jgi:hypothetical protein
LKNELFLELVIDLIAILDSNKSIDGLAGKLIADTDNSCFSNGVVLDESSFDFGGGETVTADVNNVINTATNPVVTLMITSSSVTSKL